MSTLLPSYSEISEHKSFGVGYSFGTFGELLQGVLEDGSDFLVTFPISRYSKATFTTTEDKEDIEVFPPYKTKSLLLTKRLFAYFNISAGGVLRIESELPEGKGLASSSADLVATARAIEQCMNIKISNPLLEQFMAEIEPSDGVMYSGIVSFYHRKVQLHRFLGGIPTVTILGIDEGGEIDTVKYNQLPKVYPLEVKKEYTRLYYQVEDAIEKNDLNMIGRVATQSAILNQCINPKRNLEYIIELSRVHNCLGVVVAHSGTCMGLLLSQKDPFYQEKYDQVYNALSKCSKEIIVSHSLSFESDV
ncbi:threonine kinase [Marininema mesophilum]|uniref:Threonine kinase n=1 Tax=Marininema mesophilum TaxID=1048340 RepID=A0A1H2YUV0_9BACL|nr:kinase [Marininema mesophilum]SDX08835.1 threonine kinase [Marininema mesophilum]